MIQIHIQENADFEGYGTAGRTTGISINSKHHGMAHFGRTSLAKESRGESQSKLKQVTKLKSSHLLKM